MWQRGQALLSWPTLTIATRSRFDFPPATARRIAASSLVTSLGRLGVSPLLSEATNALAIDHGVEVETIVRHAALHPC